MSQVQGQILGVAYRQSRDGRTTLYDISFSDGNKYTAFDAGLANKANGLVGQPVVLEIDIKPNPRGGTPYYNLVDVFAGAAGVSTPQIVGAPGAPAAIPAAIPAAPSNGGGRSYDPQKEARIVRGNALNAVGSLLGGAVASGLYVRDDGNLDLGRLWGDVSQLVQAGAKLIVEGTGAAGQTPHPVVATAPVTPAEVMAVANAELPGAVTLGVPIAVPVAAAVPTDDIPYAPHIY